MSIDQFSALPDSLLIHILSFLNTREAVVTSVLSKRWRFLWTDLPKLELDAYNLETAKVPKFVAWVRRALVVCSGNRLQKFEVSFHYKKRFASDVNFWVEFVKKNKVKSVALCLNIDYLGIRCMLPQYKLPRLMYSNSYVTHLTLQGCIINPRRSIKWGSLTKLYLDEIELDKYIIEKILSSCPVLYDLTLAECWGVDFLEFNSQSLHVLAIQHWNPDTDFEKDVPLVKISAPYIHSLTVFPKVYGRKVALTNISALVKAKIDFNEALCAKYFTDAMSHTNELLEGLQHVKDLEVGLGFLEVLSMLAATGWRLPQSDRESLTIHTSSDEYCIPGIICLLESSPNLRTFTINSDHVNYKSHEECFPNDLATSYFKEADLNCDLLHLKTVNMRRFANVLLVGEPMLTVAQLLLKRATFLDKMVIEFESYNDYWIKCHPLSKYVEITETLLSYERSSPNAVVLVTSN